MTNTTTTTTIIDIVKLNKVDFIKGNKGSFRVVSKCKAGFMTVVEFNEVVNEGFSKEPSQVLGWFKKGAIQKSNTPTLQGPPLPGPASRTSLPSHPCPHNTPPPWKCALRS